ncbi:MAG: PQQ-dependent sugar dehydrogenase [Arcicella sp.]|jgi:glucose/arabinose dehydrogenase|nr:PQQ-dependent sugar dehydrogenase [Arcicella sp.]
MKKTSLIILLLFFNRFLTAQPTVSLQPVITGLSQPMQLVNAGDGTGRIFIPLKGGNILVYDKNFNALGTFLSLIGIQTDGEQGLLSMCFHPQYKTNGFFFVFYANGGGDLEVARYKVDENNPNVANSASKKIVITIPHPTFTNHNGGTLRFGKDGFLYLSTGDGGGGGDPNNNAQNTGSLLGKMLRINVNSSENPPFYSIPAGNPYGNEIASVGLRNPFRWNFDRLTGDMWIGDVGQSAREEFTHSLVDSLVGVNYGWRCYEGNVPYNTGGCGNVNNYKFPVVAYPNTGTASAVGGTVYRGETYLSLKGYYLGVDFYTTQLFKIKYNSANKTYSINSSQNISQSFLTDFGETEDGEMYATFLFGSNSVCRVVADGPKQYTFIGNGNWTDANNWSNNTVPPSNTLTGSIIVIRPTIGGECIVNAPVTIATGTQVMIENQKQMRFSSNLTFQ